MQELPPQKWPPQKWPPQKWTDEQLQEFQTAHDWRTARLLTDGRLLGKGKVVIQPAGDPRVNAVREKLGEGLRVLEVGACEGQHTVLLAPFCREVVALEVRPRNVVGALIRQLIHGVRNVENLVMDAREVGPHLGRFDLIFHVGVLYHLPDPVEHLFRLKGLGDALLLDTHYATEDLSFPEDTLRRGAGAYRTRLYREQGWSDAFSGVEEASRWLYRDDLLSLVREIGFPRIEVLREKREPNGPRIGILARAEAAPGPAALR